MDNVNFRGLTHLVFRVKSLRMKTASFYTLILAVVLAGPFIGTLASAQSQPIVGKKAAEKYFPAPVEEEVKADPSYEAQPAEPAAAPGRSSTEEMMMLGLGSFLNSETYNWNGSAKQENVGRITYGFTYMLEEESKYDINLRVDFTEYRVVTERAFKMSVLPVLTFPRFTADFPIYFGVGLGLGIFFVQVPDESSLSFDYQLLGGARFMDVIENAGLFVELALKNHLLLTTNGQFNGISLTAGGVFNF